MNNDGRNPPKYSHYTFLLPREITEGRYYSNSLLTAIQAVPSPYCREKYIANSGDIYNNKAPNIGNTAEMSQTVPGSYLHLLKKFILSEYAIDITNTLQKTEYSLPDDPTKFISFEHFSNACAYILKEITDPELGLKYGSHLDFISHGPLGSAFMSCKNVADMFELLKEFKSTRFLFSIDFIQGSPQSTLLIHCAPPCMPNIVFHSQCILAGIFNFLQESVGSIHKDISIDFPYPEPGIIDKYRAVFPVLLNFDQPILGINFPNSFLEYSLPRHDEISKDIFVTMCENIKQAMESKYRLSSIICEMLDAYDTYPSLEQVAQNLNISGRTLRTHLQKEDTNYRKLIATHRIQRSKSMLTNTNTNIEAIANQLGYGNSANFNRAFKKEMAMPPTAYRNQHKGT